MKVISLDPNEHNFERKKIELIKIEEKYFIQLENYQETDSVFEICLLLAKENDILKERIHFLEERLKMFMEDQTGS